MKSLTFLAGPLVLLGLAACGGGPEPPPPDDDPAVPGTSDEQTPDEEAAAPDTDALLARVSARWDVVSHDDWVQAYDYLEPTRKAEEKLPRFIGGKEDFTYRNPSEPELLGIDGDTAYVAVDCEWTHARIGTAENLPEGGAMQPLASVELWVWVDGKWFWRATRARSEVEQERPELFEGK